MKYFRVFPYIFFVFIATIAMAFQPGIKLFQFDVAPISVTMAGNIIMGFSDNITQNMYDIPEMNTELGRIENAVPGWYMVPTYMFIEKRARSGDNFWAGDDSNELYVAYVPITNTPEIYERNNLILTKINDQEYVVDMIKLLVDDTGAVYYGGYIPRGSVPEEPVFNAWFALIPILIFIIGLLLIIKHERKGKTSKGPSFFNQ